MTTWPSSPLLAVCVVVAGPALAGCPGPDPRVEAGKALYSGSVGLQARMVAHDQDLPASAARCANCHQRPAGPSPGPKETFGSALTRQTLLEARPRRGGPASRYDLPAFCRVLREGIDPASVMVTQSMPRYRLADEQCQDLWLFLTAE